MPTYVEIRQNLIDPQLLRLKEELYGSGISFGRVQESKLPTSSVVVGGGGGTTDPEDLGFIRGITIYSGGTLIGADKTELSFIGAGVTVAGNRATIDIATPLTAKITNPLTTAGDIIYGGTAGIPTRRAIGTGGQVLSVLGGLPTWVTASGAPHVTIGEGDLIYGSAGSSYENVALGSRGAVATAFSNIGGGVDISLLIDGNELTRWESSANKTNGSWVVVDLQTAKPIVGYRLNQYADNNYSAATWTIQKSADGSTWVDVITGTRLTFDTGDILFGVSHNARYWRCLCTTTSGFTWTMYTFALFGSLGVTETRLPIGEMGQVLTVTSGYLPAWMTPSGILSASGFANPMTTAGDMIYGAAAGAATRLPIGVSGQVLTVLGGIPTWHDITVSGGSGSISVTDGTTTVAPTTTLVFPAGTITDNGGDEAEYTPANAGGYTEGASTYNNTTQSFVQNVDTAVTMNAEVYDTDTIHDNSTNPTRLTCNTAGKYIVIGEVAYPGTGGGQFYLQNLKKNGTVFATSNTQAIANSGVGAVVQTVGLVDLSPGDYVEIWVYSGVAGTISASGKLSMQRIG